MKGDFIKYTTLTLMLLTASCSDSLKLNIPEPDDMIVIDGWIENNQYAKVLLTKNAPYFSLLDSAAMRELILSGAKVTLTDGVVSEFLILRKNDGYFPPYIYEGNEIRGEVGKTYTITAEYGGKKAVGTTSIPAPVKLDTLFFILAPGSDSLGTIFLEFTDPPEAGNYYRILSKTGGKDTRYKSSMIMGISDEFFNGQKFGFSLGRGMESYISTGSQEYFSLGDTVNIKFCTIDRASYEFWNSFQDEVLNTGNPFASSLSDISSNIEGNGLGVWGGYGVSFYTCIIK